MRTINQDKSHINYNGYVDKNISIVLKNNNTAYLESEGNWYVLDIPHAKLSGVLKENDESHVCLTVSGEDFSTPNNIGIIVKELVENPAKNDGLPEYPTEDFNKNLFFIGKPGYKNEIRNLDDQVTVLDRKKTYKVHIQKTDVLSIH